jgi:hypothetical protein
MVKLPGGGPRSKLGAITNALIHSHHHEPQKRIEIASGGLERLATSCDASLLLLLGEEQAFSSSSIPVVLLATCGRRRQQLSLPGQDFAGWSSIGSRGKPRRRSAGQRHHIGSSITASNVGGTGFQRVLTTGKWQRRCGGRRRRIRTRRRRLASAEPAQLAVSHATEQQQQCK